VPSLPAVFDGFTVDCSAFLAASLDSLVSLSEVAYTITIDLLLQRKETLMESILALQSLMSIADPLDDEMCWSTCSSSNCNSSSVFIADTDQQQASC
jgi:hypothetical protein